MTEESQGYKLSDIAVVSIRGGEIDHGDELKNAAWQVYRWIRAKALREPGSDYRHNGIPGFRWRGRIQDAFIELWPAGASPLPGMNRDATRPLIVRYLAQAENLVNMEQGGEDARTGKTRALSIWWGAMEYTGDIPELDDAGQDSRQPAASQDAGGSDEEEADGTGEGFPCHEPGCPRVLRNTPLRSAHEISYHPESLWRVYHCTAGTACSNARFYKWKGLAQHISREHGIKSGTDVYEVYKSTAEAEAQKRLAQLGSVKLVPAPSAWEEPSAGKAQAALPPPVIPEFSKSGPPEEAPSLFQAAPVQVPAVPAAPAASSDWNSGFDSLQAVFGNMQQQYQALERENRELRAKLAESGGSRDSLREAMRLIKAATAILEKEGISDS